MHADEGLLEQAAAGLVDAQRALIDLALDAGADGSVRTVESFVSAEIWARLTVSNGTRPDVHRLAGILMARANFERLYGIAQVGAVYDAEALTILELAADDGDEDAAQLLMSVIDTMPAGGFHIAQRFRPQPA